MSSATKRVLFVMHTVAIGGMETLTVDVAGEFVRRGITVHAIVPENPDFNPLEDRFRKAGATVLRLSTDHLKSRATQMQRLARFVSFCKEIDPQVIHLHIVRGDDEDVVASHLPNFTVAILKLLLLLKIRII